MRIVRQELLQVVRAEPTLAEHVPAPFLEGDPSAIHCRLVMLVSGVRTAGEGTQPLPHLQLLLHVLFVNQAGDGFNLMHAVQVVFQLRDLPVGIKFLLATATLVRLVVVIIICIIELPRGVVQARRSVDPIFVLLNRTRGDLKVYLYGLVIIVRMLSVVTIRDSLDESLDEIFLTRGEPLWSLFNAVHPAFGGQVGPTKVLDVCRDWGL